MTADSAVRHARQLLLAEVGRAGQERISAATARVAGHGLAHRVAECYALRAGFAGVSPGRIDLQALAPRELAEVPAAREVLAGARAALVAFRNAALGKAP